MQQQSKHTNCTVIEEALYQRRIERQTPVGNAYAQLQRDHRRKTNARVAPSERALAPAFVRGPRFYRCSSNLDKELVYQLKIESYVQ